MTVTSKTDIIALQNSWSPSKPGLDTAYVKTFYVLIDAVDESQPRKQLLDVIKVLVTEQRFHKLQLLCTSKQHHDIESVLKPVSTSLSMDNLSVQDAVQSYVHAELYEGESFEHWPVALLDETETALAAGACRMCVAILNLVVPYRN